MIWSVDGGVLLAKIPRQVIAPSEDGNGDETKESKKIPWQGCCNPLSVA